MKHMKGPMVCVARRDGFLRGIFYDDNPLKESFNVFALQIILLCLAYQIVYTLLRPLKQTKFVCSVVAGILIGPHMLGRFHISGKTGLFPQKELVVTATIGSLGIAYFIFLVAVKMDATMLWRTAKKATVIGSLCVLIPFAATVAATFLMPISGIRRGFFHLLFASGLSVTRFANLADALDELDILTSQQSQLALSSSMISEVFTWMSLVTGVIYRNRSNPMIPVWLLVTVIGVLIVAVTLTALAKKIIARLSEEGELHVNEVLITLILVVALIMAFATDLVGSLHLGILVMGLVIPDGPPLGSAIVNRAEYMVKEFLMPVFYVLVGYTTDISSISFDKFWEIIVVVIMGFAAKILATLCGALASEQDLRSAVLLGLMANAKGPTDLYLFMRWKNREDVAKQTHAILVLSHVVLTAVVMPLTEKLNNSCQKRDMCDRKSIRAIQTNSKDEEFKILCCVHSKDNIPGMISLLEASKGSQSSKLSAVIVHLNDLVGRAAPLVVCNDKQERRVDTNQSDAMAHEFESFTQRSDDPIPLTNFIVVAPYRTMHENVCHLAQKERTTLIILPHWRVQGDAGASEAAAAQAIAIHSLNCGMLGRNPCAVGILVNKGLGRCLGYTSFSSDVRVAIIFTGGHDDREALAYGTRMLMHPSVHVTLLRLIVRCANEYVEDMMERKLDDTLIKEFWIKGVEDPRTNYFEEVAVDPLSTLNAVRTLGDCYNLVITGRRSSILMSIFEQSVGTLKMWGENPELGIIGNFIASNDFNGGKSSALIMHRYPSKTKVLSRRRSLDYDEECLLGRVV